MHPDEERQSQLAGQLSSLRQRVAELEEFVQLDGLDIKSSEPREMGLGAGRIHRSIEQTIEAISEGIVVADDRGRIVGVNRRAESLFGYHRDELQGKPVEILLPERLNTVHQNHFQDYLLEPRSRPMSPGRQLRRNYPSSSDLAPPPAQGKRAYPCPRRSRFWAGSSIGHLGWE